MVANADGEVMMTENDSEMGGLHPTTEPCALPPGIICTELVPLELLRIYLTLPPYQGKMIVS